MIGVSDAVGADRKGILSKRAVLAALLAVAVVAARCLGFDAVRRSSNPVLKYIAAPRSQFSLMLIVFASRLIPFISFDAVSYAAGLTCLSFSRFACATFRASS